MLNILFASFVGGFLLNFMPCVLPIISIKIINILRYSSTSLRKARIALFSVAIGNIIGFLLFGLFAIFIRLTGKTFGWGFHFQNPYFLIFLILFLILSAGNLIGLYNFTALFNLGNFINNKYSKLKFFIILENFIIGFLSFLFATPCIAPFLGTAISFSLVASNPEIILIFFTIGLGMSMPFLLIAIWPQLINFMPKSKNIFNILKKIMGIGFILLAFWIAFILQEIIGELAVYFIILMSFIILKQIKAKQIISAVLICLLTFTVPIIINNNKKIENNAESIWQSFQPQNISNLIQNNKIVVVKFTANWCVNCKINNTFVFNRKDVIQYLQQENIITMKADLTFRNNEITNFMNKNNMHGVPFYVIYSKKYPQGLKMSGLITAEKLLYNIQKTKN